MTRIKRAPRDASKLSGKPLSETLERSSILYTPEEQWTTSPDLAEDGLSFTPGEIDSMTLYLLANPNRMSSHLFRADVLFDSWGVLSTPEQQRERFLADVGVGSVSESSGTVPPGGSPSGHGYSHVEPIPARQVADFELSRTVVRRLIPRNPNLDKPLEQTCHFFHGQNAKDANSLLVVYSPHVAAKEDLPWYHPLLQSWALLYDYTAGSEDAGKGRLSLHFLLYPDGEEISNRLERTLYALINTQLRLARGSSSQSSSSMLSESGAKPSKDNVIPQHLVQNTYLRLKLTHASDLHEKWVEDTDPSKHIFEDLAIAAFLVELWRSMYGVIPRGEREMSNDQEQFDSKFPGFVDVACGNGVLVYLLLMEGYQGWGFDARQRKTWQIFPDWIQHRLREEVYIPQPFADVVSGGPDIDAKTHTGTFPNDTFIISNHADELTVWTPLMAALARPHSPLPFLAIPCCSHSLSGARYRYPPPKQTKTDPEEEEEEAEQNPQPTTGDLKSLRATKLAAQTTEAGMNRSMYGSLTAKTMAVAEAVGYGVEKTMLRMPSTRNMGVLGGRRRVTALSRTLNTAGGASEDPGDADAVVEQVGEIVRRECAREGGVDAAAKVWMERVKGLQQGKGSSQRH